MKGQGSTAARLEAAILEKGYSYMDLERLTGIPKSAIQRYAKGTTSKIPLDRLITLASALGVSVWEIAGYDYAYAPTSDDGYASDVVRLRSELPRRSTQSNYDEEHYYDDHAVQSDGAILASPEYQAKKYREEMRARRIKNSMDPITQEELELIKLFRSTDAKGQEMIKNIAQMVNERAAAKETDGE